MMIEKIRKISATRGVNGAITGITVGVAMIIYAALHMTEWGVLKSTMVFVLSLVWIWAMWRLLKYDWKRI